MDRLLITALMLLALFAAWQWYRLSGMEQEQQRLHEELGAARESLATAEAERAAAVALAAAIREDAAQTSALMLETLQGQDTMVAQIDVLENQLKEALRHDPSQPAPRALTLDDFLPRAAADALCLQYHQAAGTADAAADQAPAAAGAAAGADHTPAPDCGRWRRVSLREAVEWTGALLRHAGLERTDKAALRRWQAQAAGEVR